MTTSDEISIIANKLANDGKVPSVALIKSQLNQAVSLPQIIRVLKNWQHDPKFIMATHQEVLTKVLAEDSADNQEITALIAIAIAPLQQELNDLKRQVQQLIKKQQA